ncbi:MAG: glycosyltransferase [Candidatus Aenigmarchaeota archaeon]|nr:glycosyltransferase [Candidatus Aenigmarchaeota archaeon]
MKVSVIVPVYNSGKYIQKTIEALLEQDFRDFEIILVDDGSTDETLDIIEDFTKNKKIKLIKQKHAGPARARNNGAKKSSGDILLFTDSDCAPLRNWIREMVLPFKNEEIAGVQGTCKTSQTAFMSKFVQFEIEHEYEKMRNGFKKSGNIDFIGAYSAAYRKKIFLKEGGFNESFKTSSGEDAELSFRLSEKGYKFFFNPNAIVFHKHPDSLLKYLKLKFKRACLGAAMFRSRKKKPFKNSYTPVSLRLQIASFNLLVFSLFLLFFDKIFNFCFSSVCLTPILILADIILVASIILLSIPFSYFIMQKDFLIGFLTPFIIFLRTIALAFGLWAGLFNRR